MTQLAKVFKALGDPSRLRIVNLLSQQDLCVSDLQAVLGLAQPFVSRHLAYLRKAGLVRDRREGARVCYSLVLESLVGPALRSLLAQLRTLRSTLREDLEKLGELESSGRLKVPATPLVWERFSSRPA